MSSEEHMSDGGEQNPIPVRPSQLLEARRRFLAGAVGVAAFSATLSSRRALAGGTGTGCGPITAICSPTHSNVSNGKTCTGNHTVHYCGNTSNWNTNCKTATFSSCGFRSSPSGYWSSGSTLYSQLNNCYNQASTQQTYNWWNTYGPQSCNGYNPWGSSGWMENGCGVYLYNSSCNTSASAVGGWIACGLLNCLEQPAGWIYTTSSFVAACQNVYTFHCGGSPDTLLCGVLSSICTNNKAPQGCGGTKTLWANCY
jgi:hypothetical protein